MFQMSGGREFPGGAERLKALDPMVVKQTGGTVRWREEDRRSDF